MLLICVLQGHHLAEALEERGTQEVVDLNLAIEALKKELEVVEEEKKRLVAEVATLRSSHKEIEDLKAKVESLDKALVGSKAIEQFALGKAEKAVDTANRLRKEINAKESSGALATQVQFLNKHLDDVKALDLSTAEIYTTILASFGAVTPPLPSDSSAYGVHCWLKSNFSKQPDFVTKVGDFVIVSSATNCRCFE